jgi:hypothetical protein
MGVVFGRVDLALVIEACDLGLEYGDGLIHVLLRLGHDGADLVGCVFCGVTGGGGSDDAEQGSAERYREYQPSLHDSTSCHRQNHGFS